MLRGGGLCVAGPPTGDPSITKVSPRIRALQDRLMDSLPSEGAWECLSPAQREAILSIHRSRTASTDDSSEHGEGGLGRHHHHHHHHGVLRKHTAAPPQGGGGGGGGGLRRFVRSRSYDDRLESETDDSGVRGVNGTSSGANSHNSLEDDSSDNICLKRGPGRFTKAASADRAVIRREGKGDHHHDGKNLRKSEVVSNGFGNVTKIISKQMNKSSAMPNITLDCRNVQGEKRRRSRIDVDDPFRDCSLERNLEAIRENESSRRSVNAGNDSQQTRLGLTRRNVIERYDSETKLHSLKELKETGSSEEYDSGVNLKNDDSMDEYVRDRQTNGCEFNNNDFESDRTPRSDDSSTSPTVPHKREPSLDKCNMGGGDDLTVRKPSAERDPYGGWDRSLDKFDKSRPRERGDGRSGLSHSLDKHPDRSRSSNKPVGGEPLKSNMKVGYGAKLNSSFDYRTNLNQDQINKYSSNWNNIILSKDVPIKPRASAAQTSAAGVAAAASGRESRFAKNASAGAMTRSTGNLANKSAIAAAHRKVDPMTWILNDPRRTPNHSQDRAGSKKYIRSKSLDRKYLDDDSSDDDSDFETRRRTDRVRRYQRGTQDLGVDVGRSRGSEEKGRQRSREELEGRQLKRHVGGANNGHPVKARSVWDLTGHMKKGQDDFDEFDEVGFRTRSDFRNRWQSEDSDVTRRRKLSDNSEFSRVQWNRRSCDFEVDFPSEDLDRRSGGDRLDFDRKRWYRRSCDLDLDYELHHSRQQRREVEFDADWGKHALENCEEFGPEFVVTKGKKNRPRLFDQQQQQLQMQSRNKSRGEDLLTSDKRRGAGGEDHEQQQQGRQTRMENESGRRTRLEDANERRLHVEEESGRRTRLEDDPGRRTRLEEYYRARTSIGYHAGGKDKRERSRTPHLLRGKLRLLKSILSF